MFYIENGFTHYQEIWTDRCIDRQITPSSRQYIPFFPTWKQEYTPQEWAAEGLQVIQDFGHEYLCRRIEFICKKLNIKVLEIDFVVDAKEYPKKDAGCAVISQKDFLQMKDFSHFEDTYVFYGISKICIENSDKKILARLNRYKVASYFDLL